MCIPACAECGDRRVYRGNGFPQVCLWRGAHQRFAIAGGMLRDDLAAIAMAMAFFEAASY
jgi:hypothetical protein